MNPGLLLVLLWVGWIALGYYDISFDWTDNKELVLFYTWKRGRHYVILFRWYTK